MQENPAKRLRSLLSMTQYALAHAAGVSRTTIVNVEAGMVDTVPESVSRALTDRAAEIGLSGRLVLNEEYQAATLGEAMAAWQRAQRAQTDLSGWPQVRLAELLSGFESQRAFCSALCIPPGLLDSALGRSTAGKANGRDTIGTALMDAGYRHADRIWE